MSAEGVKDGGGLDAAGGGRGLEGAGREATQARSCADTRVSGGCLKAWKSESAAAEIRVSGGSEGGREANQKNLTDTCRAPNQRSRTENRGSGTTSQRRKTFSATENRLAELAVKVDEHSHKRPPWIKTPAAMPFSASSSS